MNKTFVLCLSKRVPVIGSKLFKFPIRSFQNSIELICFFAPFHIFIVRVSINCLNYFYPRLFLNINANKY